MCTYLSTRPRITVPRTHIPTLARSTIIEKMSVGTALLIQHYIWNMPWALVMNFLYDMMNQLASYDSDECDAEKSLPSPRYMLGNNRDLPLYKDLA